MNHIWGYTAPESFIALVELTQSKNLKWVGKLLLMNALLYTQGYVHFQGTSIRFKIILI